MINVENLMDRLKAYKDKEGLTQDQLGQKIGIGQATLSTYMVRGVDPKLSTAIKIANFLSTVEQHEENTPTID